MKQLSSLVLALSLGLNSLNCGGKEFTVLTYNRGGLPESVSSIDPEENTFKIAPLIEEYDISLIQEDWVYHNEFISNIDQPYKFPEILPEEMANANGLASFSAFEFF